MVRCFSLGHPLARAIVVSAGSRLGALGFALPLRFFPLNFLRTFLRPNVQCVRRELAVRCVHFVMNNALTLVIIPVISAGRVSMLCRLFVTGV